MPDTIAGWVRYVNTSNLIITISIAQGRVRVGRAGLDVGDLGIMFNVLVAHLKDTSSK